jgi:2-methylisocitrate lyase-like PEP mutase family enzyme
MGFKIVLYPTSSIRAVAKTIQDLANHLYQHKDTIGIQEKLITFEGRNQITGLAEIEALEIRFIGPK